jgi:hypothetical protein
MYNRSWVITDESPGKWTYNKNMFKTRSAFDDWMRKTITDGYILGDVMGEKSVYGVVYHFLPSVYDPKVNKDLFVLKTQRVLKTQNTTIAQLGVEANVGMTPNAPVPTVFAHRYNNTTRAYEILMRNVLKDVFTNGKYSAITMFDFLKGRDLIQKYRNVKEFKKLVNKFHDILIRFYKTTLHFHGDLHLGNIILIIEPNWTVKQMYIIDLGSVIPFPKSLQMSNLKVASDFLIPIQNVFDSLRSRSDFRRYNLNNKHFGNIARLTDSTSVVHNLKQKQSEFFWLGVLSVKHAMKVNNKKIVNIQIQNNVPRPTSLRSHALQKKTWLSSRPTTKRLIRAPRLVDQPSRYTNKLKQQLGFGPRRMKF